MSDIDKQVQKLVDYAKSKGFEFTNEDFSHLKDHKLEPFQGEISDELIEQLVKEDLEI